MYNDKFQDVNLFWKTVGNPYLKKWKFSFTVNS